METEYNNPLPRLLKYFRQKKGLTQQEVAKMINISRSGYANYEEGRCLPSVEQIMKLSKILEHDLLFAYTVSSESKVLAEQKMLGSVYDNISYLPSMDNHIHATEIMRLYEALTPHDKCVVKNYMKRKLGGTTDDKY